MAQDAASAKAGATTQAQSADKKKRTITEIRDSKRTGEKMVYTSVLDYTVSRNINLGL